MYITQPVLWPILSEPQDHVLLLDPLAPCNLKHNTLRQVRRARLIKLGEIWERRKTKQQLEVFNHLEHFQGVGQTSNRETLLTFTWVFDPHVSKLIWLVYWIWWSEWVFSPTVMLFLLTVWLVLSSVSCVCVLLLAAVSVLTAWQYRVLSSGSPSVRPDRPSTRSKTATTASNAMDEGDILRKLRKVSCVCAVHEILLVNQISTKLSSVLDTRATSSMSRFLDAIASSCNWCCQWASEWLSDW